MSKELGKGVKTAIKDPRGVFPSEKVGKETGRWDSWADPFEKLLLLSLDVLYPGKGIFLFEIFTPGYDPFDNRLQHRLKR